MRRALCTFLILLFSLGPLAATLPANAESRLPMCCRRNGAHHCSLSAAMAAKLFPVSSSSSPAFTSPAQCPCFPGCAAAFTAPIHALVASVAGFVIQSARVHPPVANHGVTLFGKLRTRTNRGPPALHIA
jgi:hypothetical protein